MPGLSERGMPGETREHAGSQDCQQCELEKRRYPYASGELTILGPGVLTDGTVISWAGENYVPQEQVEALVRLRAIAAIHCGTLSQLLDDAGIPMPEDVLRVYLLLLDELTLTPGALAREHPTVMPRLPRGMS